jgi:hypothetical protein
MSRQCRFSAPFVKNGGRRLPFSDRRLGDWGMASSGGLPSEFWLETKP